MEIYLLHDLPHRPRGPTRRINAPYRDTRFVIIPLRVTLARRDTIFPALHTSRPPLIESILFSIQKIRGNGKTGAGHAFVVRFSRVALVEYVAGTIGLATKLLRILSIGGTGKISNHLVAKPIVRRIRFQFEGPRP